MLLQNLRRGEGRGWFHAAFRNEKKKKENESGEKMKVVCELYSGKKKLKVCSSEKENTEVILVIGTEHIIVNERELKRAIEACIEHHVDIFSMPDSYADRFPRTT